jgi:hypothetical protein
MRILQRPKVSFPSCTDGQASVKELNCLPIYEPQRSWIVDASEEFPSSPPTLDQIPELEQLNRLLLHKPERSWSIDSRESTPDVFPTRQLSDGSLDYWQNLALHNERLLCGLGASKEYRRSIPSVEYWKTEAEWLIKEYWTLLQLKRRQGLRKRKEHNQKTLSKVTKDIHLSDGPISSRLRTRRPLRSQASSLQSATASRPKRQTKKNGTQPAKFV